METMGIVFLVLGVAFAFLILPMAFRRVVSTNEVHIVQGRKSTQSYGKDSGNGNVYYEWPKWIPLLGIDKVILPISVFDLDLKAYEAYDKGRLPFVIDVKAFFSINDSNTAAQRVASFRELQEQLMAVVQGAVRTILAASDIEQIMQGRSEFGDLFTKEVKEQLKSWGVSTIKNIELMDIRDSNGSKVIQNIMEKKKSLIEMQSRTEVANNKRQAEIAEVEAAREIELKRQDARQATGLKQVEAERVVQLSVEARSQALADQNKITKEKEMEVVKVQNVKQAEINKEVEVINAEKTKAMQIIGAEAHLESKKKESEAVEVEGKAKASAEKAILLAPVDAQITLAKEIGENASYQQYLITIKQIEANRDIGLHQADALKAAQIKVIANAEGPNQGLTSVMDMFSSKGGTQIGGMLEGLANSDIGKSLLNKFLKPEQK